MKNRNNRFSKILIFILLMAILTSNVMAAGYAQRVADINSGSGGSSPAYLAIYNGKLYFIANGNDGAGQELWSYDGSSASRVADIYSGSGSSSPAYLAVYNGKLYFSANGNDGAGRELWAYDGSNPPSRVIDIVSGPNGSNPTHLAVYNNKLYFQANGYDFTGQELWSYDGSNANRVADIYSGSGHSAPSYLAVFNNKLYFSANGNDGAGVELWSYDGNSASRVADIYPGIGNSNPQWMTVFNGNLYFRANGNDGAGNELWMYDGSSTSRVADIYPGTTGSATDCLAVYNNKLYFNAYGSDAVGRELWYYDGINNPGLAIDIYIGSGSSIPYFLGVFNSKLYFQANGNDGAGIELWSFIEDNTPPQVSATTPSNGAILGGIHSLEVTFNEEMTSNGSANAANNTANFILVEAKSNGFQTTACNATDFTGDTQISMDSATYSNNGGAGPYKSTLGVNSGIDLPSGSYRLFVCGSTSVTDLAGNKLNGGTDTVVSFTVDMDVPTVTVTSPADGATITPTNTLEVTFSEDMTHDGDTGAANYADNYLLVEAKGNGFQTIACNSTDFVGDTRININSASYDNHGGIGPYKTTLGLNNGNPLPNGSYKLFICGTTSVTDLAGNKINGGADSSATFTVAALAALPQTGFAPGVITQVGSQPLAKTYQDLGGLTLEIPALNISAPIVGVPRTSQGWELSWLGNKAGWLEGTSFPTWAGNSALTAHVVDSNGQPGLFANLGRLSYGKEIVISAWGQRYVYQVRSVKTAVKPEDVSAFKHKDYPYLTLITCKGYDEKTNSYRWRVVVQAVQVRVE